MDNVLSITTRTDDWDFTHTEVTFTNETIVCSCRGKEYSERSWVPNLR